jgi:tetratricopeptide (TPR) repeat protein
MATFTAFNVEAEESDDEDVDDTKEIQIEDALKLYQQALKYQSLGPQYFPQAFQAYDTLLKSEIFKYPEAVSDWQKTSSQVQDYDVDDLVIAADEETLLPSNGNDTSPSTVPQIIYLIYKNYGELILKDVFGRLQDPAFQTMSQNDQSQTKVAARKYAKQALQHFANALERDETDLELWRETARLTGESFQSLRLLRFCLESVLDQDSDVSSSIFDRLNLDERIARKDLLQVLSRISDRLSLSQIPEPREGKSKLRFGASDESPRRLPRLPSQPNSIPSIRPIYPVTRTWAGVGWAIMKALQDEELGVGQFAPGTGWTIILPAEQTIPTHTRSGPINPAISNQVFHPNPTGTQHGGQYRGQSEFPAHPRNVPPLQPLQTPSTVPVPPNGQSASDAVSPSATLSAAQSALTDTPTMTLPTRKRSSASAGNDDNADGMRGRSKRIRARESNAEILGQDGENATGSTVTQEPTYLKRLRPLLEADRYMLNAMREIYSKLDMDQGPYIESVQTLAEVINFRNSTPEHPYTEDDRVLVSDLVATGTTWTPEKAQALLRDGSNTYDASATSLDVFLEHLRNPGQSIMNIPNLSGQDELLEFLTSLQDPLGDSWLGVHQLCFRWLEVLFCPSSQRNRGELESSMYIRWLWPAELKQVIAQMIVFEDGHIFEVIKTRSARMESRILEAESNGKTYTFSHEDLRLAEMAETLYELHLDIYSLITSPSSAVDTETRIGQQDRLSRWSALAYSMIYDVENRIGQPDRLSRWGTLPYSAISHHAKTKGSHANFEHLTMRYLWAATMHVKVAEDASREHVLLCLKDLRKMLHDAHNPVILLPNNAIMPEISAIAIDQELSKVNTMGYFFKIFNADETDSFMVIESLEPILDLAASKGVRTSEEISEADEPEPQESSVLVEEMVRLLDRGSTSLKLFLWRRLQNAYDSIGYNSKAICCYLRCIDIIIRDMLAPKADSLTAHERQISLLKSLRSLDSLLNQVVDRIMEDPESLQEVDYELEQSSLCTLASLARVLYSYLLADDFRAFGVALPTTPNEDATPSALTGITISIRIRALTLQYILLKDCMQQTEERFPRLNEVLAEYLSSIHVVLGFRGQCKDASRLILRFALKEFVRLGVAVQYRFDLAQIFFDLYGWKLAPEVQIHDCPPTQLDRETALLHIDFVLNEAKRYNIKDLVKSDLRAMIDKMQQLIGGPESSTAFSINRRLLVSFLKSPINPAKLYRYTRGIGELSMGRVHTQSAVTAEKGWYFLLGHIALSRFKSQQRFSPSPTDDLNIAVAFFKQDLEHGSEKWETWYRLAQTYDAQLYEKLQWGADDINNDREALVIPQRQAIHCYGMAVATAVRGDYDSQDTNELKAQLFTDFGMRIYSSSREPLSMEVFSVDDFPRHFSNAGNPLYKGQPFRDMKLYSAWKFASVLFKRAIQLKPRLWMCVSFHQR